MPTQQQIERFTLVFHQEALKRLARDPALRARALQVLDRWEASGLSSSGQPYRDEWRHLLAADQEALFKALCSDAEHAATLRSMSPLGFLLDDAEKAGLRREAMAA
jgi:hypothetical protein